MATIENSSATFLSCENCEMEFRLLVTLYALERMSPEEIDVELHAAKIRPFRHLFVVVGILLFWFPVVGVVMNVISVKMISKIDRGFGKFAIVALIGSIIWAIANVGLMISVTFFD